MALQSLGLGRRGWEFPLTLMVQITPSPVPWGILPALFPLSLLYRIPVSHWWRFLGLWIVMDKPKGTHTEAEFWSPDSEDFEACRFGVPCRCIAGDLQFSSITCRKGEREGSVSTTVLNKPRGLY